MAQHAYLKASNTDAHDAFGISVALFGDTLVVGALDEDSAATGAGGNQADNSRENSGAVYVFRRDEGSWRQEAYLKASNPEADDGFGYSVALFDDTLAVSAVGKDISRGAVYVFRRTGSSWAQQAYLTASHRDSGDIFGWSLALSGDLLAIGAPAEDSTATGVNGDPTNNGASRSGAVYIFRRTGSSWVQEAYLKASNTGSGDRFGYSVALSGDTLAVGACEDSIDDDDTKHGVHASGAVYVFRRTDSAWVQEAYLKPPIPGHDDFGREVALSGDTLAVGAPHEGSKPGMGEGRNLNRNGVAMSGSVYVFRRTGASWTQEAHLKASNAGIHDSFGNELALSGDLLAVGALAESSAATGVGGNQADNDASQSGAVYMFRRTFFHWAQEAYVKASNTGARDAFSRAIALSSDTLAVGAVREDSAARGVDGNQNDDSAPNSGAVYVFH